MILRLNNIFTPLINPLIFVIISDAIFMVKNQIFHINKIN